MKGAVFISELESVKINNCIFTLNDAGPVFNEN